MLRSLQYMTNMRRSYANEARVINKVYNLKYYFRFFAKSDTLADDCMHMSILHTLDHFEGNDYALQTYIKNLARNFPKVIKKKQDGSLDFLEDIIDSTGNLVVQKKESGVTIYNEPKNVLEEELINKILFEQEDFSDLYRWVIDNMSLFLVTAEAIKTHNTSLKKLPEDFKKTTLQLAQKYDNFNTMVFELYAQYSDAITTYLELQDLSELWQEADYTMFSRQVIKRCNFKLLDVNTEKPVKDADANEFFGIREDLKKYQVYRINYADIWDELCLKAEETPINSLHFTIGNQEQWRTLGGSVVFDNSYHAFCKLQRDEIISNLLFFTKTNLLNVGNTHIYILGNNLYQEVLKFKVKDMQFEFKIENITDQINYYEGKVF